MHLELAQNISNRLFQQFGIELTFELQSQKEGALLILRPSDIPSKEGFAIKVLVGWKKLTFTFEPEDNSGELLLDIGNKSVQNSEMLSAIFKNVVVEGGLISIVVNGSPLSLDKIKDGPAHWQYLQLSLKSPYIESDTDLVLDNNLEDHILKWATLFFTFLVFMLPFSEDTDLQIESNIEGLPEGAQTKVITNRYERSRVNRQVCIAIHGAVCNVCGFDFGKKYGIEGEGYIEVHHIILVSKLGKDYRVDPIKDLIPLCSNCHAIIHKRNPPLSLDELRSLIRNDPT